MNDIDRVFKAEYYRLIETNSGVTHMSVKVEFSTDGGETYKELGTVDLTTVEWDIAPPPPKVRLYNVLWVRDDKGTRGQFNATPMTHREACTFKSKITNYPWRRVLLEEV